MLREKGEKRAIIYSLLVDTVCLILFGVKNFRYPNKRGASFLVAYKYSLIDTRRNKVNNTE